ncbi:peptidoglycan DD-metalloendopeptidase family protein [Paenarthrobacter sp. DKR-5]|uniref:M23 family metallopeptidase n=1 Tax=Paenarthrobacter sp. DKR-5 TaxID=2835535 RepID=UPI001BDD1A72|nr:M23 family metallopeptidase [Paenarthrobacter sp. DKR-5]MBT1003056.1 peptidoglycan DD-metalloendopeptidase family protein [Paenarthrobacter sp. DKR-5]
MSEFIRRGADGKRRLKGLSVFSAVTCFSLSLGLLAATPVQADDLSDQQDALRQQAAQVADSLEFVDAGIARSAADLTLYQGQLPGAQRALADAEARVASASQEVDALAARVDLAEQTKAKINQQIDADRSRMSETKKMIGQIATQAYKSGGVPADLSLIFGTKDAKDLAGTFDMADQALRTQNAAMEKLTQQNATNVNSQARLQAVESEIKDLKAKADAALAREKVARSEAEAKKAAVDALIAKTRKLNSQLQARKPQIQAELASVKKQQAQVAAQIAEQQRKAREAWLAAQRRAAAAAGQNNYTPPPAGNPSAFGLRHPFAGDIPITSGFGYRLTPPGTIDFYGTGGYMHTGVDFGATCGTPVYAAAAGTVTVGGWTNLGGGFTVMINHGVIQGNALTTVYYHNTRVLVSPGQHVDQGQQIAVSGSTGNSTGCHAHFETWLNGSPVDPMTLL